MPVVGLPALPADATDYQKLLRRTLDERIKDIYDRIDAVIPYTDTGGLVLASDVSGAYAGNVRWITHVTVPPPTWTGAFSRLYYDLGANGGVNSV